MSGSLGNTEDQVATPKEKTVIIGAGPTGLLVALYMCQRGHNVVLIEKRENYTSRENALIQQFHAIQLLLKDFTNFYQCGYQINFVLTGDQINIDVTFDPNKITDPHAKMDEIDIKFIESLRQAHDDVATNAFQKYIQSKITSLKNNHSFEIVTQAQAVSANEATNSIHYIDGNTTEYVELGFNNLIVCEGTQRKFTQKVISTDTVSVMQSPDDVTCAHGVGFIDVPPELIKKFHELQAKKPLAGVILPLTVANLRYKKREFKDLGWPHKSTPKFYIVAEKDPARFYLVSEIPEAWYSDLEKAKKTGNQASIDASKNVLADKLQQWFRVAILAEYPEINAKPEQLLIERTGDRAPQAFASKAPTLLRSAFKTTPQGGRIFFAGDALFTAHYKLGMGLLFGSIGAKAIADCFNSGGKFVTAEPMIKLLHDLQKEYQRRLRLYKLAVKITEKFPRTYENFIEPARSMGRSLFWFKHKATHPFTREVPDLSKHQSTRKTPKP